jgi:hypothetical protein
VAALLAVAATPDAGATLRIQNHRLGDICRVVVFVDHGRGARIVHDGPVRRGATHNFSSPGSTVCIQRSSVAQRCNSPLTRPVCRTDRYSNRTILWTLD